MLRYPHPCSRESVQCGAGPGTNRPPSSHALLAAIFLRIEEFTAADDLTVPAILDLDPAIAIEAIAAVPTLRNNPLKVFLAGKPE